MARVKFLSKLKNGLGKKTEPQRKEALFDDFVGLMDQHLGRLQSAYGHLPEFSTTDAVVGILQRPEVMTYARMVGTIQLPTALAQDRHCWQTRKFSDLCLIVSVLPALFAEDAKVYFHGQYFDFLDSRVHEMGEEFAVFNIAHWVLCSDGKLGGVHLTLMPGTANAVVVFAQDMLTPAEKRQVGL